MDYYVIFSQKYWGYIKNYVHILDFKLESEITWYDRFNTNINQAQLFTSRDYLHRYQQYIPWCYWIPIQITIDSLKSFIK